MADNFVRETDWQKEDTVIAQDDLYAHTSFRSSPFDTEHETNDQQEDVVKLNLLLKPKDTALSPPPKIFKTVGGFQQNNLL